MDYGTSPVVTNCLFDSDTCKNYTSFLCEAFTTYFLHFSEYTVIPWGYVILPFLYYCVRGGGSEPRFGSKFQTSIGL